MPISSKDINDDLDLTSQEKDLLKLYDKLKQFERLANDLKQAAARDHLATLDAAFKGQQQQQQPKGQTETPPQKKKAKKKNKKTKRSLDESKTPAVRTAADEQQQQEEEGSSESEQEEALEEEEEEEDQRTLYERRQQKLEEMREEVEAKKQKLEQEDLLRQELLGVEKEDGGPALKKKTRKILHEPSSLIANITTTATPPHDFSKSLQLSGGKVLFPDTAATTAAAAAAGGAVVVNKWTPPDGVFSPNDGAFMANLESFDVHQATAGRGNNTLAIKFTAPTDSKRFSINIAAPDHNNFDSILFHFNPRQFERGGQLVVNDKQEGTWGQAIAVPLSQVPLMFGTVSTTLIIQVHGDGFDIFVEGKHCARLEHRQDLAAADHLVLQFPSTDDYGSPENWAVYKVWWGNRPILAKGDVSSVAGVNQFNSLHPRKLFVSNLPKIVTQSDIDIRRAELERAFAKYGGDRGVVSVIVPTNSTYAFVEMETERLCDLALQEMAGQYRLNRARRSRHEALQEERAAKEAAAAGVVVKEKSSGWD